jgi:hypothetical protein
MIKMLQKVISADLCNRWLLSVYLQTVIPVVWMSVMVSDYAPKGSQMRNTERDILCKEGTEATHTGWSAKGHHFRADKSSARVRRKRGLAIPPPITATIDLGPFPRRRRLVVRPMPPTPSPTYSAYVVTAGGEGDTLPARSYSFLTLYAISAIQTTLLKGDELFAAHKKNLLRLGWLQSAQSTSTRVKRRFPPFSGAMGELGAVEMGALTRWGITSYQRFSPLLPTRFGGGTQGRVGSLSVP